MSGYRFERGGRIERNKPLSFSFDGKSYSGFAGDTLASALLANGVDIVGRSFKYHRPRGIIAAGLEEANAIVQLGEGAATIPDLKATAIELYDGLSVRAVNAWPSASFDVMSFNSLLMRFMPAGFYYKTFKWPHWRLFEPAIRKAAGLGHAPALPDPDIYDKRYAECDMLVIGGGPAGLMAALVAIRSGARVMLVETDHEWGGYFRSRPVAIGGVDGLRWTQGVLEELNSAQNATLLTRTMAFGYYDHNLVGLVERLTDHLPPEKRTGPRQRLWKVRAGHVILATGAIERPLVFPDNDRPGVMLANAGETYVHRYGVAPGRRVFIATNNDTAYKCAATLQKAGVNVVGIADARVPSAELTCLSLAAGPAVFIGAGITHVCGSRGVREVEIHDIDDQGRAVPSTRRVIECDAVLTSGGWSPAVHLFSQSGGKVRFDEKLHAFIPFYSVQNESSIGAAAGVFDLTEALRGAGLAGCMAAQAAGFAAPKIDIPETEGISLGVVRPLWRVDVSTLGRRNAKAWLDFQNDVTDGDVKLAIRENYHSVEHVKRYTTLGMASDQGKTSNVNAIGVMSETIGKPPQEIGTTTFRPPYDPVTIGAIAGRRVGDNLKPRRYAAADERHLALGAVFEDYGGWSRPSCYLRAGEDETRAVMREAAAVRRGVGLFDASPLGKIEVFGPDAGEFLNRIYVNNMKTLKPSRCRYGLMLNENGVVIDDGVCACLKENHFLVGTTSDHAGMIAETLQEWLQCEWTDLDVITEDVTTFWAVMNVNGPRARNVLEKLETDINLSADAFPHMTVREGMIEGVPCRIERVSYSGELSFEVAVPWSYGASFWDALMEAGREFAIMPFGVEALMTLRTEKGFLHVGADTDGTTLPQDVGFGTTVQKKQRDFIGKRSLMRPEGRRSDRRQLIGLEVLDGRTPLPVGGHVLGVNDKAPCATQGWVSSSAYSPNLDKPVALGLVERGTERMGEEVAIWDMAVRRRARIVNRCFFDSQGARLHG